MSLLFLNADARHIPLADGSVHMCVTSPPYYALRDYGVAGQLGLEQTPEAHVAAMVEVFREVKRVMRDDGTLWLNVGDSYANDAKGVRGFEKSTLTGGGAYQAEASPPRMQKGYRKSELAIKRKDLIGIPWLLAFALRDDGWYLRTEIVWSKRSPMPEPVRDRPARSHEYIFLLTKRPNYFYDAEAVKEAAVSATCGRESKMRGAFGGKTEATPGRNAFRAVTETRNRRTVWTVSNQPCKSAHFATFPPKLIEPCIKAGTSERGVCPHCGSPWKRIVDRVRVPTRPGDGSKVHGVNSRVNVSRDVNHKSEWDGKVTGNRDPKRHVTSTATTAWLPSCKCPAHEPVPATVLDCFGGEGTTLMVCQRLGRNGVMTELNPAYIDIARKRCAEDKVKQAMPAKKRRERRAPVVAEAPSLFDV